MREIRGWQIGEVVTASDMTLDSANIYEQTGSNGEANLPCIYNGLTLQSQAGTGNSIVTFNPGVARCQDLPTSVYTYLPPNAYGTSYPCFIDISVLDSNTVITLTTSPTPGYIVATFSISPLTSGATDYVITGSLAQIAIGSYNPAIHVRLCQYTYTGSTFVLDFTPGTHRDTDHTGLGGIEWNYQNSSLELNTPSSQSGTSIVSKQNFTASQNLTVSGTAIIQSGDQLQFNNAGNSHFISLQASNVSSNVNYVLPPDATSLNLFLTSNTAGILSFVPPILSANVSANDSNVVFTSSNNPYQICQPTAPRVYTLPSSGIAQGAIWTFDNQSTTTLASITFNASGGSALTVANGINLDATIVNGFVILEALQANPTLPSHWRVLQVVETYTNMATLSGAITTTTVTVTMSRNNHLNTFVFSTDAQFVTSISGNADATGTVNYGNLPTRFLPANIITSMAFVQTNTVFQSGLAQMSTGGMLSVYKDLTFDNFTSGQSIKVYNFSMSWTV